MKFNEKQRFSIRKYNVGTASVLIGTAFQLWTANPVSANEVNLDSVELVVPDSEVEKINTDVVETSVSTLKETEETSLIEENNSETTSEITEETNKKITKFVDRNNILLEESSNEESKKDIDGYVYLSTEEKDNVIYHIYRKSNALPRPTNEGNKINTDTALKSTATDFKVNFRSDTSTNSNNVGTNITSTIEFELGGTNNRLDNVRIEYEVEYSEGTFGTFRVSPLEGNHASFVNQENPQKIKYVQNVGNLISGVRKSIPVVHNSTRDRFYLNGNGRHIIKIKILDSNNNILKEYNELFIDVMNPIPPATLSLISSSMGNDTNGLPIAISKTGNTINNRAALNYGIQANIPNSSLINYSNYQYKITYDTNNFQAVNVGSGGQIKDNAIYYSTSTPGVYSNSTVVDFSLVYIGNSVNVPPTNLNVQLVPKERGISTNESITTFSHQNSSTETIIPKGNITIDNSINSIGDIANGINGPSGNSTEINPGVSLGTIRTTNKLGLNTSTKVAAPNTVEEIRTIKVYIPKQTDDGFKPSVLKKIGVWSGIDFSNDIMNVAVIDINGRKRTIHNDKFNETNTAGYFEIKNLTENVKDIDYIEVNFSPKKITSRTNIDIRLEYAIETNNIDDVLTDYDRQGFGVATDIKKNSFVFGSKVNNSDVKMMSNIAGFTTEKQYYYPYISLPNTPMILDNLYSVGYSVNSSLKEGLYIAGNNTYYVVATTPNLNLSLYPSDTLKNRLENIEPIKESRNNLTYYKYKVKNGSELDFSTAGKDYIIISTVRPTLSLVNENNISNDSIKIEIHNGMILENGPKLTVASADRADFDNDGKLDERQSSENIIASGAYSSAIVPLPKSLYIYDNSSKTSEFDFNTGDIRAGSNVNIKTKILNTTDTPYSNMTVITVISNENDKNHDGTRDRESDLTVKLTGPVTPPAGWRVQYSTQPVTGNIKNITNWTNTVSDYSQVTAIKYISNAGTTLNKNQLTEFNYTVKTPLEAIGGTKFVTTSSIAVNNSTEFLEGFRSTNTILKTYGSVIVKYEDENGNQIKNPETILPATTLVGTNYNTTNNKYPQITFQNDTYEFSKIKNGSKPESGKVVEGETIVTYVYTRGRTVTQENRGTINVKYLINNTTNELKPTHIESNNVLVNTVTKRVFSSGREEIVNTVPTNERYNITGTEYPTTLTKDNLVYELTRTVNPLNTLAGVVPVGTNTVTLYYSPKIGGNVTVTNKTVSGTVLNGPTAVVTNAQVGSQYSTTFENEIVDRNNLKWVYSRHDTTSSPTTGRVRETAQNVTYLYAPKQGGKVEVIHVTNTGQTLVQTSIVKQTGTQVGENYSTQNRNEITDSNNMIWEFDRHDNTSAPINGRVTENSQLVKYIYRPKLGNKVEVIHVTNTGIPLKQVSTVKPAGTQVGTPYITTNENEIRDTNGLVWTFNSHDNSSSPTTGRVGTSNQLVKYIYNPKPGGQVTKEFVSTSGLKLRDNETVKPAGTQVGIAYNGTEKPNKIVGPDGITYEYRELSPRSNNVTGTVSESPQTIIYVYQPKIGGNVTVKHKTTTNVELESETISTNQPVGTNYVSTNKQEITDNNGLVWVYQRHDTNTSPVSGKVSNNPQEVVYIYSPKSGNKVEVTSITTSGTVLKNPSIVIQTNNQVGTPYSTINDREITDGNGLVWKFKEHDRNSAPTSGRVTTSPQLIKYIFDEKLGNKVEVIHVTNTGVILKDKTIVIPQNSQIGTKYETTNENEIVDENGLTWIFKSHDTTSAPVSGRVTTENQLVKYVYEAKEGRSVNVTSATTENVVLKESSIVKPNGTQIGTPYTTTNDIEITDKNGFVWIFKEHDRSSAPINGTVNENEQLVKYIFDKKPGNKVEVIYVTDTGNILIDKSIVKPENSQVGEPYSTSNETEIVDENGLTWIFKEHDRNSSPINGTVTTTDQLVKYIYTPKLGKPVNVVYVTNANETLKPITNIIPDSTQIGTPYTTTYEKEIVDKNGLTWIFNKHDKTSDSINGTVTDTDKLVKYIYTPKLGNTVTVEFITDSGQILKPKEIFIPMNTQIGKKYNTNSIPEVTDENGFVWTFKEHDNTSAPEIGRVEINTQNVRYIYTAKLGDKVEEIRKSVDGIIIVPNKMIIPEGTQIGTEYNSEIIYKITDGLNRPYRFVKFEEGTPNIGKVSNNPTLVTHLYEKVLGSGVDKIFTTLDGKHIKNVETVVPDRTHLNTSYITDFPKTINYNGIEYVYSKLNENSAPLSGTSKETLQTIHVMYVPKINSEVITNKTGSAIVNFLTENGTKIKDSITLWNNEIIETKKITYYNDETPTFTEIIPNAINYSSIPLKQNSIVYNGFEYELINVTGDSEEGILKEGNTVVNYIYKPISKVSNSIKTGTVIVKYLDITSGNEIKENVDLISNGKVSEVITTNTPNETTSETILTNLEYSTENVKFDTLTHNNFDYELIKVSGDESGLVNEGLTQIIYYYKAIPKKSETNITGNVTVKYVDKNNNEISNPVILPEEIVKIIKTTISPENTFNEEISTNKVYNISNLIKEKLIFDGNEYEYTNESIGNIEGLLKEGNTTITLIYDLIPIVPIIELPEDPGVPEIKLVTTNWIDTDKNVLKEPITQSTTLEKLEFEGYEYVETITDDSGNITHIYKKIIIPPVEEPKEENPIIETPKIEEEIPVKEFTTKWVTDKGINLKDPVIDTDIHGKGEFEGYEYIETKTDNNGNVTYIYREITKQEIPTPTIVEKPIVNETPVSIKQEKPTIASSIPQAVPQTKELKPEHVKTSVNEAIKSSEKVTETPKQENKKELPNTNSDSSVLGLMSTILMSFGLFKAKKKND